MSGGIKVAGQPALTSREEAGLSAWPRVIARGLKRKRRQRRMPGGEPPRPALKMEGATSQDVWAGGLEKLER